MKKYIICYTLLAMISAQLVQAAALENPEVVGIITVHNNTDAPIHTALAHSTDYNTISFFSLYNTQIEAGQKVAFNGWGPMPKKILLAATTAQALQGVREKVTSLAKLRMNRNVEFKAIPQGCKQEVVCRVKQGRIGKL